MKKQASPFSYFVVFGICGLAFFASSCRRPQASERVVVTGASTLYPIVQMAAEELRRTNGLDVVAQATGSGPGLADCEAGRNDLGAVARDLTPEEKTKVMVFPIGYDAIGIVVNKKNQIAAVTTEELGKIYRRKITTWSSLNGQDSPIKLVHRAPEHATRGVFMKYVGLTEEDMQKFPPDIVAGPNAQVILEVANNPAAIGYVSLGEAIKAADSGVAVRPITFNGIEPVMDNVYNRTYPLYHSLNLVSKREPTGGSRVLLDFLRGPEGKAIIRRGNYVPMD
jgi:phosphate transport system substrate-binding protein